jgi:galactonate dehydratase
MGVLFAKALEPYGLYWFEEPCWPENVAAMAEVQRAVVTPIATGERVVGLKAFSDLLESRACSILQPDITHCGGLSEARRIAALCEVHRAALAPHNPQGPVSTAASLELGFATPSYLICESVHADVPWRAEVVREGFAVEHQGRVVRPGNRPGLGIEIDEAQVKKHPFQQELPQRVWHPDGAVGDW